MGGCCSSNTQMVSIDGNRMARYDSSWDSNQKLNITLPLVSRSPSESVDNVDRNIALFTVALFRSDILVPKVFAALDESGDGELDYGEFVAVNDSLTVIVHTLKKNLALEGVWV